MEPSGRPAQFFLKRQTRPQHTPGKRIGAQKLIITALKHDPAPVHARFGSHIHYMIRQSDHFPVMLYNHNRISMIFQLNQRIFQILNIA